MSEKLQKALDEYKKKFNDDFPTIPFVGNRPDEPWLFATGRYRVLESKGIDLYAFAFFMAIWRLYEVTDTNKC